MLAKRPAKERTAEEFKYLLRALLRQASYLPDLQARQHYKWGSGHERNKFPLRWRNKIAIQQKVYVEDEVAPGRKSVPARLRLCRQHLYRLERANQGYRHDLLNVLLMAYGRKGPRRHWLLKPLLDMDIPKSAQKTDIVAEQLARHPNMPATLTARLPTIPPAVRLLLVSQQRAKPPSDKRWRKSPKGFNEPAFAEVNIWNRPTPVAVAKNKAIKHFTEGLNAALPPIPVQEFESLQRLAHEGGRWAGPIKKRLPATPLFKGASSTPQVGEEDNLVSNTVLHTSEKEQPHTLTPRYMRHLYEVVFRQCCKMEFPSDNSVPVFHWGRRGSKFAPGPSYTSLTEPERRSEPKLGDAIALS